MGATLCSQHPWEMQPCRGRNWQQVAAAQECLFRRGQHFFVSQLNASLGELREGGQSKQEHTSSTALLWPQAPILWVLGLAAGTRAPYRSSSHPFSAPGLLAWLFVPRLPKHQICSPMLQLSQHGSGWAPPCTSSIPAVPTAPPRPAAVSHPCCGAPGLLIALVTFYKAMGLILVLASCLRTRRHVLFIFSPCCFFGGRPALQAHRSLGTPRSLHPPTWRGPAGRGLFSPFGTSTTCRCL